MTPTDLPTLPPTPRWTPAWLDDLNESLRRSEYLLSAHAALMRSGPPDWWLDATPDRDRLALTLQELLTDLHLFALVHLPMDDINERWHEAWEDAEREYNIAVGVDPVPTVVDPVVPAPTPKKKGVRA